MHQIHHLKVRDGIIVLLKQFVKISFATTAGLCDYSFSLFQLLPETSVGPALSQLVQHLFKSQEASYTSALLRTARAGGCSPNSPGRLLFDTRSAEPRRQRWGALIPSINWMDVEAEELQNHTLVQTTREGRQKAEHPLGHDLADFEQQRPHLVLEGIRFSMLEGGTEFSALGSFTNSAHPNLRRGH
ncbi:hypothetical protein EYF80_026105 [Liparis tanakae]|uniref:Uncharacterized protein n=1 Tax=Liparis tanakae TaxID=230148 RepID=A0A4Z2HCS9_9TELE|nr:hypothetical protein EYF80_026105 [Liparis tanakae]